MDSPIHIKSEIKIEEYAITYPSSISSYNNEDINHKALNIKLENETTTYEEIENQVISSYKAEENHVETLKVANLKSVIKTEADSANDIKSEIEIEDYAITYHPSSILIYNDDTNHKPLNIKAENEPYEAEQTLEVEEYLIKTEEIDESATVDVKDKPHVCTVCNKRFSHRSNLSRHMKRHGEKQFLCEICSKSFVHAENLKLHLRYHTGVKSITCKICNKAFVDKSKLKVHLRCHSGEKPYTCKICNQTFAYLSNIKKHAEIHAEMKLYPCKLCSKQFSQARHVRDHMRIHTGEKLFTCEICSRTFIRPDHLKRHMKRHTGKKIHDCELCDKTFKHSSRLLGHIKKMHAEIKREDV